MQAICTHLKLNTNIRKILGYIKSHSIAKAVGSIQRKGRKCSITDYLLGFWLMRSTGQYSYDSWAANISRITGKTISGQAVCKRSGAKMIAFLKQLLTKSFRQKCSTLCQGKLFETFSNVYIQDATHFSLPRSLAEAFPGSYSKYGDSATAKVQATINLAQGVFCDFLLASFRDNDQKDAPRIVEKLKQGDLLIRDLGYFTLSSLNYIRQKSAHFLSRYNYGTAIYDIGSGRPINLLKNLKKYGSFDRWVQIGKQTKVTCRLIALPLPASLANQRRRKAKKDRHKGANHNKQYLEFLGYTILITSVDADVWTPRQVLQAYKCRWYIEILFKGWKSALNIKMNIPERYLTKTRAEFFFYASLLMVNLLVMPIFCKGSEQQAMKKNRFLSILKTCSFVYERIYDFIVAIRLDRLLEQLLYFGAYEVRKSRTNAVETINFMEC